NYVGVTEGAHDMFGKLMSIPDEVMANYYTMLTAVPEAEIKLLTDPKRSHPMETKKQLAVEITLAFHPRDTAEQARQEWEAIHQKKAATGGLVVPADTPTIVVSGDVLLATLKLIVHCGFAESNNEARRLIAEKGIRLNGEL